MKRRHRTMKSFCLYRMPLLVPSRYVQDYSFDEQAQLYEAFQVVAARYRRQFRVARYGIIGFVGCILVAIILKRVDLIGLAAVCWSTIVIAAQTSPPLVCPGCDNLLELMGGYCPECGGTSIRRGSSFKPPQCMTCGKALGRTRAGRTYKIRVCTHCGVILDQKGL